jgi:hypothetical protein
MCHPAVHGCAHGGEGNDGFSTIIHDEQTKDVRMIALLFRMWLEAMAARTLADDNPGWLK